VGAPVARARPRRPPPWEVCKYLHFGQNELEFVNENSEPDRAQMSPARTLRPLVAAGLQRPDQPVDEGLRGALVGHGLEQAAEHGAGYMRGHPFVLAQHVLQAALLGDGLLARLRDQPVGLLPADLGGGLPRRLLRGSPQAEKLEPDI
jgi:hypothetical protein